MIALDGEIIRLKSTRITLSMEFREKDTSGQTSGTDAAEQGEKGKELQVTGMIPFSDQKALARLFELAQAKGRTSARSTASAANWPRQSRSTRYGSPAASRRQSRMACWPGTSRSTCASTCRCRRKSSCAARNRPPPSARPPRAPRQPRRRVPWPVRPARQNLN